MIYLKDNPKGFDIAIDSIQNTLHSKLLTLWGIDLDAYPRCYDQNTEKNKGIVHFKGSNDYTQSLIHKEKNKFFFLIKDKYEQNSRFSYSAECELFFILNLVECKPLIQGRADEEVLIDVLSILKNISYIDYDIKVSRGKDDIFKGYEKTETIDMQPYHCFKITFTIKDFNVYQKKC